MKAGTLNVEVQENKVLWYDRKRILPFGLPWSFTKYTLTENTLLVKKGVFKEVEDEVRLYRCVDVTFTQTIWEKICNTGTVIVESSDNSMKIAELKHIKNAKQIKEAISQAIESARARSNVKTSEFVGA